MFSITTFQELLKGLPRAYFDKLVNRHNADKYVKRFGSWDHLIAMLYGQLSGAPGLRAIETGFNSHSSHHYHLGTQPIKRSTLADANERRSDTVFKETASWLMGQVSRQLRRDSKELMYLLDSTSLTLKGKEFDRWTLDNRTRNTQGVKLHVLFDGHLETPVWQNMTAANVNDIEEAVGIALRKGALYVFDKGYNDYNWWHSIDQAGARFVTRFKSNASVCVVEELSLPGEAQETVIADELVSFKRKTPGGGRVNKYFGKPLRRVIIKRPDHVTPIVLATNDLTSTALEVAQRYKERWGIELFFKWIKQHLKIKQFLGRSENAVRIQVTTALISYLLVALHRQTHHPKLSLWECLCHVRATLFQRREIESAATRRRRRQAWISLEQGRLF